MGFEKPHILISSRDSEEPCPGNCHEEPIPDFCSHGVRNALGTTFQLKSKFTPSLSLTPLEPLQGRNSLTAVQPTEANMTMPQLKRMRQASTSIIRRTGRMAPRTDWSNVEPTFSALNAGFLNDDIETKGTLNLESFETESDNEACRKTPEEIASPMIVQRMSFSNQPEVSHTCRPESPQMIFQNNNSDEVYQLREYSASEAQVLASNDV